MMILERQSGSAVEFVVNAANMTASGITVFMTVLLGVLNEISQVT